MYGSYVEVASFDLGCVVFGYFCGWGVVVGFFLVVVGEEKKRLWRKREREVVYIILLGSLSILLFKRLLLFRVLIFSLKNAPTLLCLSRDKIKGQSGKNTTLTFTKALPKI